MGEGLGVWSIARMAVQDAAVEVSMHGVKRIYSKHAPLTGIFLFKRHGPWRHIHLPSICTQAPYW